MNGTVGEGYFDRAIEVELKSLSACEYISQNACKVVTNKTHERLFKKLNRGAYHVPKWTPRYSLVTSQVAILTYSHSNCSQNLKGIACFLSLFLDVGCGMRQSACMGAGAHMHGSLMKVRGRPQVCVAKCLPPLVWHRVSHRLGTSPYRRLVGPSVSRDPPVYACTPGWPGTNSNPPAVASQVLGS